MSVKEDLSLSERAAAYFVWTIDLPPGGAQRLVRRRTVVKIPSRDQTPVDVAMVVNAEVATHENVVDQRQMLYKT